MKKLFAVVLMLSLLLVGCQNSEITDTALPLDTPKQDVETENIDICNTPYKYNTTYGLKKETDDFRFTLESSTGVEKSKGVLLRGMDVTFDVSITNLRDESILTHAEADATVKLICKPYHGEYKKFLDEYIINAAYVRISATTDTFEMSPGETMVVAPHTFFIPEHAIPGSYSVVCSYDGSTVEFEDVFVLD